ncbi:conserved hypothetical protein, partial [Ricinus communis]
DPRERLEAVTEPGRRVILAFDHALSRFLQQREIVVEHVVNGDLGRQRGIHPPLERQDAAHEDDARRPRQFLECPDAVVEQHAHAPGQLRGQHVEAQRYRGLVVRHDDEAVALSGRIIRRFGQPPAAWQRMRVGHVRADGLRAVAVCAVRRQHFIFGKGARAERGIAFRAQPFAGRPAVEGIGVAQAVRRDEAILTAHRHVHEAKLVLVGDPSPQVPVADARDQDMRVIEPDIVEDMPGRQDRVVGDEIGRAEHPLRKPGAELHQRDFPGVRVPSGKVDVAIYQRPRRFLRFGK